jgi:hypothetical protein
MIELKESPKSDVEALTEIEPNLGWSGIEYEFVCG